MKCFDNLIDGPFVKLQFYHLTLILALAPSILADYEINDKDVDFLFTNEYLKAFSNDFTHCMFQVENNTDAYHTCESFNYNLYECKCSFLKSVNKSCRSFCVSDSNFWFFEQEIEDVCKQSLNHTAFIEANETISNNTSSTQNKKRNHDDEYNTEVATPIAKFYGKLNIDVAKQSHPKTHEVGLTSLNFEEYYDQTKSPTAMTIDCDLMKVLKILDVDTTKKILLRYSTTIAFAESSTTRLSEMEIIKVVENSANHKRSYNENQPKLKVENDNKGNLRSNRSVFKKLSYTSTSSALIPLCVSLQLMIGMLCIVTIPF